MMRKRQRGSRDKAARFLALLAEGFAVAKAARGAGVHRATVYTWRNDDPHFARRWDAAEKASRDAARVRALGNAHSTAKLSGEQVAAIRASNEQTAELAERFGISPAQIRRIRSGDCWRGQA
jgi:transposase